MGSSHIQPAWESNNNNKKKSGGEGRKRHCCSRFSRREPKVQGARGASQGGRCGAGRGQRALFPAGVGRPRRFLRCRASGWRGRERGPWRGLRVRRRLLRYLCGPRPGPDPRAGSRGSFLGFPWICLHLLRRVLNGASVRSSVHAAVPSVRTPWGSRHLFL